MTWAKVAVSFLSAVTKNEELLPTVQIAVWRVEKCFHIFVLQGHFFLKRHLHIIVPSTYLD